MKRGSVWCRVCGGEVLAGEGTTMPELEFGDAHARIAHQGELAKLPPEAGEWRRTCAACERAWASSAEYSTAMRALLGVDEPEHVARAVIQSLTVYNWQEERFEGGISAKAVGKGTGKPWGHVTDSMKDALNAAYAREAVKSVPATSDRGACGCCGVRTALGEWTRVPNALTWPDGAPVAFCRACAKVWMLRGEPTLIDDLRKVGAEAATGKPIDLAYAAPEGFRLFAESRAADPAGVDAPWAFSQRLTEYIENVWSWNPQYAPADRRAEFERKRADHLMRQRAQRLAERREVEARAW